MNDRFKFRAKDKETGEWRYGYYAELPCGLGSSGVNGEYADTDAFILTYTKKQSALYSNAEPHEVIVGEQYKIDEKTLSQCTGLKDKNGKLIYEGDVLKNLLNGKKYKVAWVGCQASFELHQILSPSDEDYKKAQPIAIYFANGGFQRFQALGNIYENPELLEVKND